MSIPMLIGLLVLVILVASIAGVWRARTSGTSTVQSSLMVLALAVVAAAVVFYLVGGF